MKLRKVKKMAVGLAATAGMVGGLALSAPATASAAPLDAPTVDVTQDGNNVTVKMTPPALGSCGVAAIELGKAVEVLNDPIKITDGGPGIVTFPNVTSVVGAQFQSTQTKLVSDGVYVVVGSCLGDPTIQPIIVPTGFGSLQSGVDFGSTVLENPELFTTLIGLAGTLS